MDNRKKLIVSHAPFWHNGSTVKQRNYHIFLAALPAAIFGMVQYGAPAVGVLSLSVAMAMIWEIVMNRLLKRPETVMDGNAALIGLLFGMLMPAVTPWWFIIAGTFICVVIGKMIYGGIGANPFNPVVVGVSILMLSWPSFLDFDIALVDYKFDFNILYPLAAIKYFGLNSVFDITVKDLLMGHQIGGIGSTFGIGLIIGGLYLILRGFIRWEISLSFLAGVFVTALLFNLVNPDKFADPLFHLFTGYTLIGAFFLVTEDSSSPVNFIPMLIYGAGAGMLAVLIRNIGAYVDGVILAILVFNVANPLLDKIRPKALGKVVENA